MTLQILDGKKLALDLKEKLRAEVASLKEKTGKVPSMVNIMIGEDHGASAYSNSQKKAAEAIGIQYELKTLPTQISQEELIEFIALLNNDADVNGVMLHKPVPAHIDHPKAIDHLDPSKDVEGMNVSNIGKMVVADTSIIPCTPAAVMEHLKTVPVSLKGKEAVIVGRSDIVGKPLIMLLLKENATVTVCHSGTSAAGKLVEHLGRADVVVAAMGKAHFIKGEWIKPGAIVIDVGINQLGDKMVGDVEFETAKERAAYITPVPGGVGPVTVVMLMKNCIEAFKSSMKI
ncbi:MAG: bifunctional 5,10-methylenetetrahydrofolate dehydrogenase/5,10-methenyltetrahydrofolate cyclohydrolase [Candidatus Omnitrophica bacterium]|nr:bifunctional 5,10-methylenetetrahydrofolate dehydrogenase/5,10-methenyltetrahydrofolate cyclohydrolase [Candidatus Omnitrophota bacterium]